MGATDDKNHCEYRSLESLPTELLVYIASFLPTIREKAKLRYVSRRLRSVGEASSLWSEFIWPQYDSREEVCVKNLLDVCAHHVRRISFPDCMRLSGLLKPLSRCCKLTQLSLPSAELIGLECYQFGNTLQQMGQLERLEVRWDSSINPLLLAVPPRLKELTVCAALSQLKWGIVWAHEWVTNKFVPQNLNIIIEVSKHVSMSKLLQAWPLWNSFCPNDHSAELRLYRFRGFKVPLNLFDALPMFQLHFSHTAMLPFVKAASFGLLGIEPKLLMLTDQNGTTHKAEFLSHYPHDNIVIHDDQLDHHVTSLNFITHFDAKGQSFHPGHLEQLVAACPNLQRLNLESNYDCLGSLQGLRMIASSCYSLEGLNLQGIGISKVEKCMQLWEILSSIQLTHLAVETCVLNPFTDDALLQNLAQLFQKFLNLKALELSDGICEECQRCCNNEESFLLSNFPSLVYCKMSQHQLNFAQNIISSCEKLKYFNISSSEPLSFSTLHNNNSLLQLRIKSDHTILTDDFMKTLSAHGQLVHVILRVFSVTCSGIITLITNSPKLITLHITTHQLLYEEGEEYNLEVILSEKFPRRKLFTAGKRRLTIFSFEKEALIVASDTNRLQQNTDLLSLW